MYHSQGVGIHAKHIEIVVCQILYRVIALEEVGDTNFLPDELADQARSLSENRRMVKQDKQPISARPELMGAIKASLATDSWLSVAPFQETIRALTEAATNSTDDPLSGLKGNVILGKLIPARTDLIRYRNMEVNPSKKGRETLMAQLPYNDTIDFGDFTDFSDASVDFPFGV